MKLNRYILITVIGFSLLDFIACKTAQTGMIIGDNYDEKKNQTTLTLLPYGDIVLPDKWIKTSYNPVSKQHYFKNNDSTNVALAKNPKQDYPFYKSGQPDKDYLKEFTKWESDYFKTQGATANIVEDQSDNGYIIWKATIDNENINTIYLFGLKDGYAYNLSGNSKNWSSQKIQEFLIKLFIHN